MNSAFNAQIAIKRVDAAIVLVNQFANGHLSIQRETLRLAMAEIDDAIAVMNGAPLGVLNPSAVGLLVSARLPRPLPSQGTHPRMGVRALVRAEGRILRAAHFRSRVS